MTTNYTMKLLLTFVLTVISISLASSAKTPLVVITWNYLEATQAAWKTIDAEKGSAVDTIEKAGTLCEEMQCRRTVGFGGSPDEEGETTQDALIMDGVKMDVGAVGGLRNIKNAIGVARKVLDNTKHSLLGGDLATEFAVKMGFKKESLQTEESKKMWEDWKANNCQPNFWKNVVPDPDTTCGPYRPMESLPIYTNQAPHSSEDNHDTIGIIAIDSKGSIAAGTSTNGARNKIPGRIGDSPIAGAGAYADQEVGAAAGTGDGDVMMRFLPSFLAVEEMRRGNHPVGAAEVAVRRIAKHYPDFRGAVIALNKDGDFGAACHGYATFPYYAANANLGNATIFNIPCTVSS